MTLIGSAHFAPSGLAAGVPSFTPSPGSNMVKPIVRPSGDHAMSDGLSGSAVIVAVVPVSIQRTAICGFWPSARDAIASRLPSGDQRGRLLPAIPSGVCLPLATSISHTSLRSPSIMMSPLARV